VATEGSMRRRGSWAALDGTVASPQVDCCPYPTQPPPAHTTARPAGERLALAANGRGGLAVCVLRPSGIFGEWDTLMVPTTVRNAQKGKMKYIIGSGRNEMDWTYAGNVAQVGCGGRWAGCAGGCCGCWGGRLHLAPAPACPATSPCLCALIAGSHPGS
jgi:hypothetical protein